MARTLSAKRSQRTAALLLTLCCAGTARAAILAVSNCNDGGPGSLRSRVAAAASGDTIDLSHLTCGRITLTGGQIEIPQNDLLLVGHSRYFPIVDGINQDRVFWHRGTGTLRLDHLTVEHGLRDTDPAVEDAGGCILSAGNVELRHARVHRCMVSVSGFDREASGGAIMASGHVLVWYSAVFDSVASDHGFGGGIRARDVTLYRSQIYYNRASIGGGIFVGGGTGFKASYSVISTNRASDAGGGIYIWSGPLYLDKTTVSNNSAVDFTGRGALGSGGGIRSRGRPNLIVDSTLGENHAHRDTAASFIEPVTVLNSTVAFNVDLQAQRCEGALNAPSLHLESTIVARNLCRNGPIMDIGTGTGCIVGHDNLIENAMIPVPSDTISANPRLSILLAWNGGITRTFMPAAGSPVLEHGSNLLGLKYDQRGPHFPRVKGAFPDIGAVER